MTERQKEWHLDRRVTITLIIGLIMNAGATGWWAANIQGAIQDNQEAILLLEERQDILRTEVPTRLVRIESRLDELLRRMDRQPPPFRGGHATPGD